jgi:hypothetical protein
MSYMYIRDSEESECYAAVRDYVKNGYPENHFAWDLVDTNGPSSLPSTLPKKLYEDWSVGEHKYAEYPKDVREAARFRDGMVYAENTQQLVGRHYPDWGEMYMKKCKVEYLYLMRPAEDEEEDAEERENRNPMKRKANDEELVKIIVKKICEENLPDYCKEVHDWIQYCDEQENSDNEENDDDGDDGDDGDSSVSKKIPTDEKSISVLPPPTGTCRTVLRAQNFMNFCFQDIDGNHSQSLMRLKIIMLLEPYIAVLPKTRIQKQGPALKKQSEWLHAILILLRSVRRQWDWITWKLYSGEDLDGLTRMAQRVQTVMQFFVRTNFFDGDDTRRVLATITDDIEFITNEHKTLINSSYFTMDDGSQVEPLWKLSVVESYKNLVQHLHEKYSAIQLEPSSPTELDNTTSTPTKKKAKTSSSA